MPIAPILSLISMLIVGLLILSFIVYVVNDKTKEKERIRKEYDLQKQILEELKKQNKQ